MAEEHRKTARWMVPPCSWKYAARASEMACGLSAPRRALESGKAVREPRFSGFAIYAPVRIKPHYWTSESLNGSVIHMATGRGILTQGKVATRGQIAVESHCNGQLQCESSPSALD
ncbi:hypothetical protein [Streptomyces sp. NPDC059862]|uniref:hypothetical protein n=1 Tax=unclassified Streptomyces TaxID=2593676 RepID=UPI00362D6DE0